MTLAMLGFWTWAAAVAWDRLAPGTAPGLVAVFTVSSLFTIPGLMLGVLTLRARAGWIVLAAVPITANLLLLVLPPIVIAMRATPGG